MQKKKIDETQIDESIKTNDFAEAKHVQSCLVKRRNRQFGSAKGLIRMAPDFDAPVEDFKEYME